MKTFLAGLAMMVLACGVATAEDDGPVVGIGVGLHLVDQHPVVDQVLPDSPAFKKGVQVGDRLLKIDGESIEGVPLPEVAKRLRGAAGTRVKITVLRRGENDPRNFSLKRQLVTLLPAPATPP
jgi:carboxyl-terminal processing protease